MPDPIAVLVSGAIASWPDGLSVTRLMTHRGQIWLHVRWAGVTRDVRLGKRTGTIGKPVPHKRLPPWENDKP